MKKKKGQKESDEAPGAPEWMVTFSDCMTLLLTFFVLLLSFSTFEERTFSNLKVIYSTYLPSVGLRTKSSMEAVSNVNFIRVESEPSQGSEKPTDEKKEEGGLRQTQPLDYYNYKVFVVPSRDVFWASGNAVSARGREILSTMAAFLRENPVRVVLAETDLVNDEHNLEFSLSRAYTILNYLVSRHGLDKDRFNMSAVSTINKTQRESMKNQMASTNNSRILEIVLLEWSIYN